MLMWPLQNSVLSDGLKNLYNLFNFFFLQIYFTKFFSLLFYVEQNLNLFTAHCGGETSSLGNE